MDYHARSGRVPRVALALPLSIVLLLSGCGGADKPILTAGDIVQGIEACGLPFGESVAFTEEDDPNKLLGRPGQYTSKANFHDSRLEFFGPEISASDGGSVEVFGSDGDAATRKEYLEALGTSPLFLEYDYQIDNVLLRLSKDLAPSQTAQYERAFDQIVKGKPCPTSIEQSPTATPERLRAVTGAQGDASGILITLNDIVDPWIGGSSSSLGMRFVAIDLTVENSSTSSSHYLYAGDFRLTDKDDFAYEAEFIGGPEPRLLSGELFSGDKIRGWIVFEVNEGTALGQLQYIFSNERIVFHFD